MQLATADTFPTRGHRSSQILTTLSSRRYARATHTSRRLAVHRSDARGAETGVAPTTALPFRALSGRATPMATRRSRRSGAPASRAGRSGLPRRAHWRWRSRGCLCPPAAAHRGASDVEIMTASRRRRSRSEALLWCRLGACSYLLQANAGFDQVGATGGGDHVGGVRAPARCGCVVGVGTRLVAG
jgi:hypothetical protein